VTQLTARIELCDSIQIRPEQRPYRRSQRHPGEATDAGAPFAGAARIRTSEIVEAGAGMRVDHPERLRLLTQMNQDAREHGVFDHIGEIAGMECVTIVHDLS